jgi:hypothetical protein
MEIPNSKYNLTFMFVYIKKLHPIMYNYIYMSKLGMHAWKTLFIIYKVRKY